MSEPVQTVAVDLPLSTTAEPVLTGSTDEVSQSETPADSVEQSHRLGTSGIPIPGLVSRETEPDPVSQAVETAVQQWIGFDPSIHAVNEDGTPRLRVDGSYARKRGRGGRKSGDDETAAGEADLFSDTVSRETPSGQTATAPQASPTQTAPNLTSQQAAAMLVIACTTVMGKLVGPEWHAEKPEQKALVDATKIYLDSKGGLNVTPEMGLFIAVSMYAVPRLAHENTRSKFGMAVDWCRDRITVLRARFKRG